jgi:hypothetical protein
MYQISDPAEETQGVSRNLRLTQPPLQQSRKVIEIEVSYQNEHP